MSFDEVVIWLLTAMSLTAVAFLFWTLAGIIRSSRRMSFSMGSEAGQDLAPPEHGPA